MKRHLQIGVVMAFGLCGVLQLAACKDKGSPADPGTGGTTLPPGYEKFTSDAQVSVDGDYIVVETTSVPNHKSPYFPSGDPRHEAYNGTNPLFQLNPNTIQAQQVTFRIPKNPVAATTHQATPLGPIGVALNGVSLFNQYAAGRMPLTGEKNSFDQYDGHPQMSGHYHYHVEPFYLTTTFGRDALIGFLLDGFPVYGPIEGGQTLTDADLDEFHGHTGPTVDYPDGIYHYHVTADDPYINGAGYYGVPGTIAN